MTGWIPEELRSQIRCAMKNSRYDYELSGEGVFVLHISRTAGKTVEEVVTILKQCIERLGRRAGVKVSFTL